jgi:hypothetical protein
VPVGGGWAIQRVEVVVNGELLLVTRWLSVSDVDVGDVVVQSVGLGVGAGSWSVT